MTKLSDTLIPNLFNIGQACTQPGKDDFDNTNTAIIVDHDELGARSLSYHELNLYSNKFAHALSALNVEKGARVLLWLPNCCEFPIAFFGTLKQGAIAVPASMMLTPTELEYLANDAEAEVLVTTPELWNSLNELEKTPPTLGSVILTDFDGIQPLLHNPDLTYCQLQPFLEASSASPVTVTTQADDPAYLVYTSGTTGYPKGVLHAHRSLLGRLPSSTHWFHYSSKQDCILHTGKFNWTYVLGTALMDPLYQGKKVVLHEGETAIERWPELVVKHQCNILIAVPTIYRQILQKTELGQHDMPSLRHCMCAGEHLSDEVLEQWKKRFKLNIYEAVGMSECSYYLSQHMGKAVRPGSAGFPQPGHLIELLDEDMNPVEDGVEGMLCIREDDPGLFLGYWKKDEETRAHYTNGYFCTGDYAKRDEEGYFWFLGRKDDIINSFGYRISPIEIERVLKTSPHIQDCVVVAEEVESDKHIVSACVILKPNSKASKNDITEFAKLRLAAYKVPKAVHLFESFPKTTNGKVLRKSLKATLKSNQV